MATHSIPNSGPSGQHALYRFFDDTADLLYVGITIDPSARWKKHRQGKHWWHSVRNITIQPCDSREAVLLAEREAIVSERPRYNHVHSVAPSEPCRDTTVVCDYCHRPMIRYWDDEVHDDEGNQCQSCNEIMCYAYDVGYRQGRGA